MSFPMTYQPQGLPRGSRRMPRTMAVIFGDSPFDVFGSGVQVRYFNNPERNVTPNGYARRFVATRSTYATIPQPDGLVNLSAPFAFVITFTPGAIIAGRLIHYSDNPVSGTGVNVTSLYMNSTGRLYFMHGPSATTGRCVAMSNDLIVEGKPLAICCAFDGVAFTMHINGVLQTYMTTNNINNQNSGDRNFYIGRRAGSTSNSFYNGNVSMFAHVAGLVDGRSMSDNPWQIFEDTDGDEEFIVLPAAPVGPVYKMLRLGSDGRFVEIPIGQESGYKILVLYGGRIRERVGNEGAPLTLLNGRLHTQAVAGGVTVEPPVTGLPPVM